MAETTVTTMWCGMCSTRLPLDCFYRSKSSSNGALPRCKACRRESARVTRKADPEWYRETQRQRVRNAECQRQSAKRFRAANRELCNARTKASRKKKLDHYRASQRARKKAHPERVRADDATRRARKASAAGPGWTAADVAEIKLLQRGRCAICRDVLKPRFHRDHIVPLAKGGAHHRRNLQLLCEPCNLAKGARHPADHARTLGLLL